MKVIFVFAHPDDETFSSGGTIALLAKKRVEVKLITATRGEKGRTSGLCKQEELGMVREEEQKAAAKILGISKIYRLGFPDDALNQLPKNILTDRVLEIFKKEQPDIVVTFNEEGGSRHPDHIQVSKSATEAFLKYLEGAKKHVRLYYNSTSKSYMDKLRKQGLDYRVYGKIKGTPDELISTIIDTSKFIEQKIKASKSHKTQQKDWKLIIKRMKNKEAKKEYFRLVKENNIT